MKDRSESLIIKCFNKIKLLRKNETDSRDLVLNVISHLLNFTRYQRYCRRKFFPISKVVCSLIDSSDCNAYKRFRYNCSPLVRIRRGKDEIREGSTLPFSNAESKKFQYVARYKNNIIANVDFSYCCSINSIDFWEILGFIVLLNFQGYGIGTKLIETAISSLDSSKSIICLSVESSNFRAKDFYKKFGFREDEKLLNRLMQNNSLGPDRKNSVILFRR